MTTQSPAAGLRSAVDTDGFVAVTRLIPAAAVDLLRTRLEYVLERGYETGIFPDEAYYRPGTTLPDAPRHVVNAWKCDRRIAAVALSETLAAVAAEVFGWDSLRLAVDTVWMKPSSSRAIEYHREFEYFKSLTRPDVASCWIALDDMAADNGSLEFAAGSHRWPDLDQPEMFRLFGEERGHGAIAAVAAALGVDLRIERVSCPAGGGAFFDGRIWHGSQPNRSHHPRRAYGIHWIRGDARLAADRPADYLFGRYKLTGSLELHEAFFPVVWSADGYRSPWLDSYLTGGPLGG